MHSVAKIVSMKQPLIFLVLFPIVLGKSIEEDFEAIKDRISILENHVFGINQDTPNIVSDGALKERVEILEQALEKEKSENKLLKQKIEICKCNAENNTTHALENTHMLMAMSKEIWIKNLTNVNNPYKAVVNQNDQYLRHALGVSFDPVEHRVYWTDIFLEKIVSSTLDGTHFKTWNHSLIEKPEFLAIDYIGRNIYYSDNRKKHIGVCSIQKTNVCRPIITSGLTNPRGIAVYPKRGLLAYSNWDDDLENHPHIGIRYVL